MSLKKLLLASGVFLLTAAPGSVQNCPPPRQYQGPCSQVVIWAKNPETGTCCYYPNPCTAPAGWMTYTSQAECEGNGGPIEI